MAGQRQFDVFVSYGHTEGPWVRTLAENLHRLGLEVWLDLWELVGGERLSERLQQGIEQAGAVVAVVSPHWVDSGWCREEFAAAVSRTVAGRQRIIPVLLGDVDVPAFLASRLYVDFRNVAAPEQYRARVEELARAVRGEPAAKRPPRGGPLVVPDTVLYRPDGPVLAGLKVDREAVVFSTAGAEAEQRPGGVDHRLDELLWRLRRARAQAMGGQVTRAPGGGAVASGGMPAALGAVGAALGERFLGGEAGSALEREVVAARGRRAALRLGLQVDTPEWADLPWETLTLPGQDQPLVLADPVQLYRTVARETAPPEIRIPGPLRILAVVAGPDTGGGELLDYERELAKILDIVDPARSGEGAHVRVLNWGSLAEIRAALVQERFHVLHLSCHASPGYLLLEDEQGRADRVDAERFVAEALPEGRGVPLVVLSGCATALAPTADTEAEQGRARAGLARELLGLGVPAVLAMTDAVTDHYATNLTARLYAELADAEHPEPLAALSWARRALENERRQLPAQHPHAALAEWATPALFLAGPPLPLFLRDPQAAEPVQAQPDAVLAEGMVVRRVGDFVGRRTELRRLLAALRDRDRAGVLLHGIGGVGKSTLAAELIHHLGDEAGLLVPVSATSVTSVDAILEELRRRLTSHCVAADLPERDPLRQVAVQLTDASPPWQERWGLVRQIVLPRLAVLLVLDNAEDLLTAGADGYLPTDGELADFLAAWASTGLGARLLITSRHPFALPRRAQRRLDVHHLGPLSWAETRKLMWRLPGLDALGPSEQYRAYTDVGGHPRALEYLDALLRGGRARFPDLAERMERALERRGIRRPERWLAEVAGDLDRALAETITLAVDDVLLDGLLSRLDGVPGASRLLEGLAVYRIPVDATGAAWQLSDLVDPPDPDPALMRRVNEAATELDRSQEAGVEPQGGSDLSLQMLAQFWEDLEELRRPPVALDEEAERALDTLLDLGLLSRAPAPQDEPGAPPTGLAVHRWTAGALQRRMTPEGLVSAHRRAAAYWHWRVEVWPQDRSADVAQLLEARHHYRLAGDLDQASACTAEVTSQLHTWGAWDWEQRLIEERLSWFPTHSRNAAICYHQLGMIAHQRGEYGAAEQYYSRSLAIDEELGNRVGIATSYHQLGLIAQERGEYGEAEQYYRRSLAIEEEQGNRVGIATSYGQLGNLAYLRGEYAEAEQHYRGCLTVLEEAGERARAAVAYHQLGVLAQHRGEYGEAEQYYRRSLAIKEELGNRLGIATTYGELGNLAYRRGEYAEAEQYYRSCLSVMEELGNRVGIAAAYHQLGMIAEERGEYGEAEQYYRRSLAIEEELGNRAGIAASYHQLGIVAEERGEYEEAEQYYRRSVAIKEELGNRAGLAASYHQLGVLLLKQQHHAEATRYLLSSLILRLELGLQPVTATYWLGRQRAILGDPAFRTVLSGLLSEDDTSTIMEFVQPVEDSESD